MPLLSESLLRAFDRTADLIGIGPRLHVDEILGEALEEAGCSEFSSTQFLEPLKRLVWSYEQESNLSVFGRFAARFDILRALRNLLRFDYEETLHPQIKARSLSKPIFITGLPRSGTTFLHTLMSFDPLTIVPRAWQLIYPYADNGSRACRQRVERQIWLFRQMSPGLDGMHPLSADAPQECTDITAQVFQSLRFDTTHHIPSYSQWIDGYGHHDAFLFHRRFLQHLDYQFPGRRWVLKCPDHIFTLNALRKVYPDSYIIVLHRDPVSVLASVAKLTDLLRRPFTRHVDQFAIGRQVSERWEEGASRMVDLLRQCDHSTMHVHYSALISNPLETIQQVYDHCQMRITDEFRQNIRVYVDTYPRGGYAEHRYSLAEFGLDESLLRTRFARYVNEIRPLSEGEFATSGTRHAA